MSRITRSLVVVCLAALAASPSHAAIPSPISNSVKYRDAGAKPATGRSGSAAIQVRALRGRDGTDVEVTTGQFDGGAAPVGTLDKVQVKVFNLAGDLVVTDNYRKGSLYGGYGTFTYNWPIPGQSVQVQANVSGIDPKRTDVVTVPATVQMRPDLIVASVVAPAQAYRGSVVTIDAVVREGNGQVGARANCVLKADGVEIDRANGIWVDAGDAVTVEFRNAFATLGQKQLSVELTDVRPGDYDDSNNSAGATINIVSPSTPLVYLMSAQDLTFDLTMPGTDHMVFQSSSPINGSFVRDTTSYSTQTNRIVTYAANLQVEKGVEFPVSFDSRLTVDGQPLIATSYTVDENPNSWLAFSGNGYWNRCGDYWDGAHWSYVCHFHSDGDGGLPRDLTTVVTIRTAGSVTYASTQTSTTRYESGLVDVFTANTGGSDTSGGPVLAPIPPSLGSSVAIHSSFTDAANQHYEAEVSVPMVPLPIFVTDGGEQCVSYDWTVDNYGHITGTGCIHPVTVAHGAVGQVTGQIQN